MIDFKEPKERKGRPLTDKRFRGVSEKITNKFTTEELVKMAIESIKMYTKVDTDGCVQYLKNIHGL